MERPPTDAGRAEEGGGSKGKPYWLVVGLQIGAASVKSVKRLLRKLKVNLVLPSYNPPEHLPHRTRHHTPPIAAQPGALLLYSQWLETETTEMSFS